MFVKDFVKPVEVLIILDEPQSLGGLEERIALVGASLDEHDLPAPRALLGRVDAGVDLLTAVCLVATVVCLELSPERPVSQWVLMRVASGIVAPLLELLTDL